MKKSQAKTESGETISVAELSDLGGVSEQTIRTLVRQKTLPDSDQGKLPRRAAIKALIAHFRAGRSTKADIDAETLRNKRLDAEAKEREAKKADGELIGFVRVKEAVTEHVGAIRQTVKDLLLLEQPAVLAGRSEADIRTINSERWTELNRAMRNTAGKIV